MARSSDGRLAAGVLLLELVAATQVYVVSALLPLIVPDLHAAHRLGLVVTGTTIGMFVTLPLTGRAVDRFGLGRVLVVALAGYLAGLLATVTATTSDQYAAGQLVQGAASGMLAVFGLSAVIRFFEPARRARLLALTSAMWIVPALAVPPAAVALGQLIGWRATVVLPFPLLVAGRWLTSSAVRAAGDEDEAARRRYPLAAALALPAGVAGVVAGTSGAPWPVAAAGAVIACVAARSLLPRGTALARRGTPAALLALVLFGAGYFGADSLLTVLFTTAGHASLFLAGEALTGGGVGWGVASLATARLSSRGPERAALLSGMGLLATAAGVGGVTLGIHHPLLALGAWVVASAGVGVAYPSVYLAATTAGAEPPRDDRAAAAAGKPAAAPILAGGDLPASTASSSSSSASAAAPAAGDLAAGALIAESFGSLLGRSAGGGIASLLAGAEGLRVVYALFAGTLVVAALAGWRTRPAWARRGS